jgi:alginate O-acetyltransferase complex protein AlgI
VKESGSFRSFRQGGVPMLFCSQQFLIFFAALFLAYWTLDRLWGRAICFALAAGYVGWEFADFWSAAGWALDSANCWHQWAQARDWPWGLAVSVAVTAVLAIYCGADRARVWLLLLASFCFYAAWNKGLAAIICATTTMDYLIARGLDSSAVPLRRRLLLLLSLTVNLGLLCYFKYANFFLDSLGDALRSAGATTSLPVLSVIVPVGISFYTFEAISYTVDVYRRRLPAERDLARFMVFILFFPHLIAGPIVRARDFLPQLTRRKRWDWYRLELGVRYFLLGLFKKLAIADRMAQFVDPVFADLGRYQTYTQWAALFAYALQIYCDFSGYSDMALGAAHALGYKLKLNFNLPYLSANLTEFWQRWHISLSSWLRDYVFFPLGGTRGGRWRTARNLLLTMTLCGLWHGASWNWLLFGLLQGLLLCGHRAFRAAAQVRPWLDGPLRTRPGTAARVALTFLVFMLTLVFVRSSTLAQAGTMFYRLFVPCGGAGSPLHLSGLAYTAVVVAVAHALGRQNRWRKIEERWPDLVRGCAYAAVFMLALLLAPATGKAFIYFQF